MEIQQDFKELLELFNAHQIDYLIVGGYALAFHGAPRFTGDIDLFIRVNPENAKRIINALDEFGFGNIGLTVDDFLNPDNVIQLGVPPVRIDIITSISGVSWEQAFRNRIDGTYGDVPVKYIGLEDFITNKRASGRKQDIADLEALDSE